jgi:enoyl-CoA hydratase/carnithine racemase
MNDLVTLQRHDGVALLTMNRPEKRNALDNALTGALADRLTELQRDATCRAVVISGGRHFCAGGSLDNLSTRSLDMRADMRRGHVLIRAIISGRLPVIAAVEGAAFGAGLSLAAACDFVVADTDATFGAVYGKVGIMPDWAALWTLPQRIGLPRTRRFVMFGEVVDGRQAEAIGLVDVLALGEQVLATALDMARRLAEAAPGAISATKSFIARFPLPLDALLDWEADTQALLIASEDFSEGRAAFFEKRPPRFKGT